MKGLKCIVEIKIKNSEIKDEKKGKDIFANEKNKKKKEYTGITSIKP